jgi:hypothetical protein
MSYSAAVREPRIRPPSLVGQNRDEFVPGDRRQRAIKFGAAVLVALGTDDHTHDLGLTPRAVPARRHRDAASTIAAEGIRFASLRACQTNSRRGQFIVMVEGVDAGGYSNVQTFLCKDTQP